MEESVFTCHNSYSLCCNIFQFEILLPPLHALVQEVKSKNLRGGRLLDLLHTKCHCGLPELQMCMQRYMVKLNLVVLIYYPLNLWDLFILIQESCLFGKVEE